MPHPLSEDLRTEADQLSVLRMGRPRLLCAAANALDAYHKTFHECEVGECDSCAGRGRIWVREDEVYKAGWYTCGTCDGTGLRLRKREGDRVADDEPTP